MKKIYSILLVAILSASFPGYLDAVYGQNIMSEENVNTPATDSSTVVDNVVPDIICPASITIELTTSACSISDVDLGTPIVNDNVGVKSVINDAPKTFKVGLNVVSWVVTDVNGNVNFCNQYVLVTNQTPPQISCPAKVVRCAEPNETTKTVTGIQPSVPEQCPYTISYNMTGATTGSGTLTEPDQLEGMEFNIGTTVLTYTITNINSWKTASCSVNIEVKPYSDVVIEANYPYDSGKGVSFLALPGNLDNSELSVNIFPNPASDNINIVFQLPERETINIEVYKMNGMKVMDVFEGELEKDFQYKLNMQVSALHNPGIYFLKFRTSKEDKTARIVYVK